MKLFDGFPWSNSHQLNLDWLLDEMKKLEAEFSNYQALNHIQNAGVWDISKNYQKWSIVTSGNTAYIALQPVPPNVPLSNGDYWLKVADLDTRIDQLEEDVNELNNTLDTILPEVVRMYKNTVFASTIADPTGNTDCSSAFAAVATGATLIIDGGIYKTSQQLTIGDRYKVFFAGGIIQNTQPLTLINVTAGKYQICEPTSSITIDGGSAVGCPEWFGAKADGVTDCAGAMQLAVNTLGKVVLSNGIYKMNAALNITKPVQIIGEGIWNALKPYTHLKFDGNLGVSVYDDDSNLENVSIRNLTISTVGGTGLSVNGANRGIFEDLFVYNSEFCYSITRTVGCVFNRCNAYVDFVGNSVGFNLYGAAQSGWPFVGDNASLFIQNCRYIGLPANIHYAYGIKGYNSNADLFIENFEASQVNCGILLDGSDSRVTGNIDIHIRGAVVDVYENAGIEVKNMQPSSCIITDCYVAPKEQDSAYSNGIHINGAYNVTVSDCTIYGGYISNATDKYRGITLTFAQNVIMSGNIITKFTNGILILGKCINIRSDNTITPTAGNQAVTIVNSVNDCAEYVFMADNVQGGSIGINGTALVKITVDTATLNNVQILLNGSPITETTDAVTIR